MPSILIADDDPSLLAAVSLLLEASGYVVETTGSTRETLERWPRTHPDLVIVDLHMPGGGMELVRAITRKTSIPVIVLSADDQASVKVAALDAGAEDYITKPFAAAELLARIRVALRRGPSKGGPITVGGMTLSEGDRSVSVGTASAKLTPTEFDLLKMVALKDGFVTTADLLHDVWGPAYSTELDYVRVYMRRLRAKLDSLGAANAIESRPGLGYRLTLGAGPAANG